MQTAFACHMHEKNMRNKRVIPDEAWRASQNYRIFNSVSGLRRVGLRHTRRN